MTSPPRSGPTPGNEGRFEGYDVVAQRKYWDRHSAAVVLSRLEPPPDLAFFLPAEAETAGALFDLVLAQHRGPKIPVLAMVDARIHEGSTDGWRYEDMPEDGEAWRMSLAYLDQDAQELHKRRFHECPPDDQARLLQGVQDGDKWHGLPAKHVWSLWSRYACAAFYAHPWAWNEIGFGGPAYPRGYKVLRPGWREPWERPERDADDPVPWADRVEQARRAHREQARGK